MIACQTGGREPDHGACTDFDNGRALCEPNVMAHDEVQLCKEAISISRLVSVRFIDGKAQDRW